MKSEQQCLWISRASFLISAAALVSVAYRGLMDSDPVADGGVVASGSADRVADGEPLQSSVEPALAVNASDQADRSPTADHLVELPEVHLAMPAQPSASDERGPAEESELAPVRVKRLVVTEAVEGREPVEVSDVVSGEAPVIAFVELATGQGAEQNVVVTFEHEAGRTTGFVNLSVPGNQTRWRTWGRTYNVDRNGRWTAIVRDSQGEELGRTEFTVRRTS